jgi:hypothetical protein
MTKVLQIEDIQEELGSALFKIVVPPGVDEIAFLPQFPSNSGQAAGQHSSVGALSIAALLADEAKQSGPPQPIQLASLRDFASTNSTVQSLPLHILVRLCGTGLQVLRALHECVVSARAKDCKIAALLGLRVLVPGQSSQPQC